jgi:8-oxo-dGTP diphosphatase
MLDVVAVALADPHGRVLLQRRHAERQHGGLWEFPGGKLEPSETAHAGLLREVWEELGLRLAEANMVWLARAEDPAAGIVISLYTCRFWLGEPLCLDAAELGWFEPSELTALAMPPLDRPLAQALQAKLKSLN